jgi:hypothetical protein
MNRIILGLLMVFLWGCNAPVQQDLAQQSPITASSGPSGSPDPSPSTSPSPTASGSPTGQYLYVLSSSDHTVYAFGLLSDGNLSLVQTQGVQVNATILSTSTDGSTLYVYAMSQITQFAIDSSNGTLTNTTPGYSQSIFVAESAGADFSAAVTSETVGGVEYAVAGTALSQSVPATNYSVGADPVALALR